tara:strand:- start:334 stop:549 length:216 start_codon:yes stop_codon:yes gene_type:complete
MPREIIFTNLDPKPYAEMKASLKIVEDLGSRIHELNRDIEGMQDQRDKLRARYQAARSAFYNAIGKEIPNA